MGCRLFESKYVEQSLCFAVAIPKLRPLHLLCQDQRASAFIRVPELPSPPGSLILA